MRRILGDDFEEEDVIFVPELLLKRSQKEQALVARKAASNKATNSKSGNEEKDEKHDHPKGENNFDGKQAAVFAGEIEEQALLNENISFEWMRNKTIPVYYLEKNREQQSMSVSANLQACIIPKGITRECFFTATHINFFSKRVINR